MRSIFQAIEGFFSILVGHVACTILFLLLMAPLALGAAFALGARLTIPLTRHDLFDYAGLVAITAWAASWAYHTQVKLKLWPIRGDR